jgi:hypothetical protein
MEKLEIAYGRRTFPNSVVAVWGARLIWPNDLVPDRQDLAAREDGDKAELIRWLNGPSNGDGALSKALGKLRADGPESMGLSYTGDHEAVIYEDTLGRIIGSAQGSHGYLYVCGWMFKHDLDMSDSLPQVESTPVDDDPQVA